MLWQRAALGAAAVLLGLAAPAHAIIQGHAGKIAFQSSANGGGDILIADRGSGAPVPMPGNEAGARDARPAWAPPAPLQIMVAVA
jgi:hypothetical protein